MNIFLKFDVTDFDAVDRLVQETVERTGRLDYIFNQTIPKGYEPP
jgi:NAD(P)-dependent dehydrogenase (short-subunit alcohol dehydrogenase family)